MDSRANDYKQLSGRAHIRERTSMYLGNKEVVSSKEYKANSDDTISLHAVESSHAAFKCADEIIVNGIDQWTKSKFRVNIWFSVDAKERTFTIKNDYTCIPVLQKTTLDGRLMWLPQFLFSEQNTSGNYDQADEKGAEQDASTGGTFGLGATLVNNFSEFFEVETIDPVTRKYYYQLFEACNTKINEPEITTYASDAKVVPGTKITIKLNYSDFKMDGPRADYLLNSFFELLYMRAIHTAVYIAPQTVYWNNVPIKITTPTAYIGKHITPKFPPGAQIPTIYDCTLVGLPVQIVGQRSPQYFKWNIGIGIRPSQAFECVSIVNGVSIRKGGTHVEAIRGQIIEYMKPLFMVLLRKHTGDRNSTFIESQLSKFIFLFMSCRMNGPSFNSQRKDEIDNDIKKFVWYVLTPDFLKNVWEVAKPYIEIDMIDSSKKKSKKSAKKTNINSKQFQGAEMAGRGEPCHLFIAEGNSAMGMLDKLITCKESAISYRNYGVYSIQGVPVNVRKEIKYKVDPRSGARVPIHSKKLLANERINAFIQIIGLVRERRYTMDDVKRLNYQSIIIATDQDEDGKGNIRSLVMNIIQTEWPSLIECGFVRFMITPVVRAFHKDGAALDFMSERQYEQWRASVPQAHWEAFYYKGLAGHGDLEMAQMAHKLLSMIILVTADKKIEEQFAIYFGDNPDARKTVLRVPTVGSESDHYVNNTITATNHLNTETHSFQLYNITRHMPNEIDGMLPTSRKILCGASMMFAKGNKRCLLYQLVGYVTEKVGYHHGDTSAASVAIGMAQAFPGATNLPMLRGLSHFGTKKKGGTDAGSARYIYVKMAKELFAAMYPSLDTYLLSYTLDTKGKRGEPKYYCAIVPPILESIKNPAHGWAVTMWAREFGAVYAWVRASVLAGEPAELKNDFPISKCGSNSDIITTTKGTQVSIGKWKKINGDSIVVTELPIGKWNVNLISGGKASKRVVAERKVKASESKESKKKNRIWDDDPNIVRIYDASDADSRTEINITFQPGFLSDLVKIESGNGIDPVTDYLGLKQSLKSNLNLIGLDGAVKEYKSYIDIARRWFPVRKALYADRIARERTLLELRIVMYLERLRFARERDTLALGRKSKILQVKILEEHKFAKFDSGMIDKPMYATNIAHEAIHGSGADVDYLLKMNSLQMNDDGMLAMEKKIAAFRDDIAELNKPETFPGARVWLRELEALKAIVDKGQTQGWGAWDPKPKWGL